MSGVEWVAFTVLALMVLIFAFRLPKYWRGELKYEQDVGTRGWWPLGEALRQAFFRTVHVAWVMLLAGILLVFLTMAERSATGAFFDAIFAARMVFGVAFVLASVLDISITLFNRPKALVPPSLRHEPGAIQYWRSQRGSSQK